MAVEDKGERTGMGDPSNHSTALTRGPGPSPRRQAARDRGAEPSLPAGCPGPATTRGARCGLRCMAGAPTGALAQGPPARGLSLFLPGLPSSPLALPGQGWAASAASASPQAPEPAPGHSWAAACPDSLELSPDSPAPALLPRTRAGCSGSASPFRGRQTCRG